MALKPITTDYRGQTVELHCYHEDIWPPVHAYLGDLEELRKSKVIDQHKYEQIKTWKRVCGLSTMKEGQCTQCPLARLKTDQGLVPFVDQVVSVKPPFAKKARR